MVGGTGVRKRHAGGRASARVTDISDEAVRRATGRDWSQWFTAMDGLGGDDHTERARRLAEAHPELSGWWCQSVTVQYERARGLRARHETSTGFQVSVQRTVAGSLADVWAVVLDGLVPGAEWAEGAEWEVEGVRVEVRIVREGQLRFWWHGGSGRSTVVVTAEGLGERTVVRVQHEGLASRGEVEAMRGWWRKALERVARSS